MLIALKFIRVTKLSSIMLSDIESFLKARKFINNFIKDNIADFVSDLVIIVREHLITVIIIQV